MAMKENTVSVLKYLQANLDKDLTSSDVAEALNLGKRQVDSIFTSAMQRKGTDLGFREEAEIELENGSHQKVKYLRLTEKGKNFNPDAPQE